MRLYALLVLAVACAGTVSAQSLADVARKEGERRESVKDAGKTYTNQDLKRVRDDSATAAPADASSGSPQVEDTKTDAAAAENGAGAPGAEPKAEADATASQDRAGAPSDEGNNDENEAHWSERMAALREKLERDRTFLDALQSRVDALTTDFVNRDDPAQRSQIGNERQKTLAELDRLRKSVEDDQRAITAFEEEARQAGVPAGWLR